MTVATVELRSTTRVSTGWWLGGLAGALVFTMVVAAGAGQLAVSPGEVLGSILHRLGLDIGSMPAHPNGDAVLWQVRFPRVAMGAIVGAALGMAGALMQGLFRNPLAEPAIVGVSSGAAVGACISIVAGLGFLGVLTLPAMAFGAGLVTTMAVYRMSRSEGGTDVSTIVLTGIAVNAVAGGLVSFLLFAGDRQAREQIIFWQLGSLNGSRWEAVGAVAGFVVAGFVGCAACARRLDLLALGERSAGHLGVNVERLRLGAIVCVALLVGPAVAFSGIIGFVGLVVAHVMRIVVGPSHRRLLPASALAGSIVLVWADLFARTAVAYADLPIGMLTALIGGPAFFLLLRRARSGAGGWA